MYRMGEHGLADRSGLRALVDLPSVNTGRRAMGITQLKIDWVNAAVKEGATFSLLPDTWLRDVGCARGQQVHWSRRH
eukprot:13248318-Alexandrium_andersonii.AAC.1